MCVQNVTDDFPSINLFPPDKQSTHSAVTKRQLRPAGPQMAPTFSDTSFAIKSPLPKCLHSFYCEPGGHHFFSLKIGLWAMQHLKCRLQYNPLNWGLQGKCKSPCKSMSKFHCSRIQLNENARTSHLSSAYCTFSTLTFGTIFWTDERGRKERKKSLYSSKCLLTVTRPS